MRQMPIQRQTVPRRTLDERATLLLPQSSHDWIERFMVRLQSLRPDLLPGDTATRRHWSRNRRRSSLRVSESRRFAISCRARHDGVGSARFRNQITLSDLSGQDARAHGNDSQSAIEAVRAFLSAKNVGTRTRGPAAIWSRYDRFGTQLPRFAEKLELEPSEIRGFDFLRAYLQIVAEWIKADATRDRRR